MLGRSCQTKKQTRAGGIHQTRLANQSRPVNVQARWRLSVHSSVLARSQKHVQSGAHIVTTMVGSKQIPSGIKLMTNSGAIRITPFRAGKSVEKDLTGFVSSSV